MNKKYLILLVFVFLGLVAPKLSYAIQPSNFGLKEGDLISAIFSDDPDVYIINDQGYKRLFLNPEIFKFYGHLGGFFNVKLVTKDVVDAFPTSGLFRDCENNDQKVYGVDISGEDIGQLHWINTTGDQAVKDDPNFFKKVFCINNAEFNWYPKGSLLSTVRDVPNYERASTNATTPIETITASASLKDVGRVVICHYPSGSVSKPETITIDASAVRAHLAIGDKVGQCSSTNPTPTPKPTCPIRPACLDATPRCLLPEPTGGWCPIPTPTPTPAVSSTPSPTTSSVPQTLLPTPTTLVSFTATPVASASNTPTPTPIPTPTPTPTTTAKAACIVDSDRSLNYGVAGYTTFSAGTYYDQYGGGNIATSGGTLYDTCVDSNTIGAGVNLKEVYCDGNSVSDPAWPGDAFLNISYIYCSYGCNNGACNSSPTPAPAQNIVFSNKTVTNITSNSATITFTTNVAVAARVTGDGISDVDAVWESPNTGGPPFTYISDSHSIQISGLSSNRTYVFDVFAFSTTDNAYYESSFTTLADQSLLSKPSNFASIYRNLTIGSVGNDVKQLQALLVNEVNYPADLITGYFGQITRDAVKRLQEKYGVRPMSGYFGEITRRALSALISN